MLTLLELKNKSCLDLFFLFLVSSELEWTTLCGCILVVFSFCKLLMGKQLRAYFWRLQNSFQEKIPFFFMGKKNKTKEETRKKQIRKKWFSFLLSQTHTDKYCNMSDIFQRFLRLQKESCKKSLQSWCPFQMYWILSVRAPYLKDKAATCWDASSVTSLSFPYLTVTIPYSTLPDTLINSWDKQNYILESHCLTKKHCVWIPNHSLLKSFLPF